MSGSWFAFQMPHIPPLLIPTQEKVQEESEGEGGGGGGGEKVW